MTKTTNGRPASRRFTPKSDEAREAELSDLKETLVAGVASIKDSEDWKAYLRVAAKFHNYSLNNIILCMVQLDERGMKPLSRIASYNAWKGLNRNVKKGEKGLSIFAPIIVKVKPGDKGYDPSVEKTRLVGFRVTKTFDYQQTEGEPLPERPAYEYANGDVPSGLWDSMVRYAESKGFSVSIGDTKGAQGYTHHGTKVIVVSEDLDSDARRTVTLAHEIAHAVLHAPENFDYAGHRGIGETEAESVAFIVGTYFGIDTSSESFHYIAGWAPDSETISKTGTRIMRTVREIVSAVEPDVVHSTAQVAETAETAAQVAETAETATEEPLTLF